MKLRVIALDFDGTIANEGVLDSEVAAAIEDVRRRGLHVVLVTGRIVSELRRLVRDLRMFDAVVAENGAVVSFPHTDRSLLLGRRASPALIAKLEERGIAITTGECIVDADAAAAPAILEVIRELELPLTIQYNRSRVMILPQSISKSTGLREALAVLRLSPHDAAGFGDAENDHELLEACELGIAVAWGSAALQRAADEVLQGEGPPAVARRMRELASGVRVGDRVASRRRVLLGSDPQGGPVELAVGGRNVLICGDPRSGKSWVAGLLAEQLVLQRYALCIVDPEGDYRTLEALPGVVVLGGAAPPPAPIEVARLLRHPDLTLVVDLSQSEVQAKRAYVAMLLATARSVRRATAVPHRIVIDEAHDFLRGTEAAAQLDLEGGGYTLVTYRAAAMDGDVRRACEVVILTRQSDADEIDALNRTGCPIGPGLAARLRDLAIDEAALVANDVAGGTVRTFRIAPRITTHVRHRHKYLDVPLPDSRAFTFTLEGRPPGPRAHSLRDFVAVLGELEPRDLSGHLARGDFSRWVEDVFGDIALATQLREIERDHRLGRKPDPRAEVMARVEERYPCSPREVGAEG